MNTPYVKQYDLLGNVTNKYEDEYPSKKFLGTQKVTDEYNQTRYVEVYYPNRKERRSMNHKQHAELFTLKNAYLKQLKIQKQSLAEGFKDYVGALKQNVESALGNFISALKKTKLSI